MNVRLSLGFLGLRLVNGHNEDAHITDAVALIASAVSSLHEQRINISSNVPSVCDEAARWDGGPRIFRCSFLLLTGRHCIALTIVN